MARDLPTAVTTAIAQRVVPLACFAEFEFSDGTVRMWNGYEPVEWQGETWLASGDFAGISTIDETTEIGASGLAFTLSGIPSSILALAYGSAYRGRPCRLWIATINTAGEITGGVQVFGGLMDIMPIDDQGETSSITIQAESRMVDLGRARTSRYTDAEQQALYPGDRGCEYVTSLAEKPLPWGVATPASAASASYNRGGLQPFME